MRALLVVENDAAVVERIRESLGEDYPLEIVRTDSVRAARSFLMGRWPAVVLAAYELPDGQATDLIDHGSDPLPLVVMVEPEREYLAARAIKAGSLDYVLKNDAGLDDLRHILDQASNQWDQFAARANTEHALRRSEERHALIARGASVGLWDLDYHTNQAYFSPRLLQLLGYEPGFDFQLKTNLQDLIHPEDQGRYRKTVAAHLKDRAPYDIEIRIKRADGTYSWFRVVGLAEWDNSGNATRIAGSIEDISTRKEAEETARRLGRLIDQSRSEVYVFDTETYRFLDINRVASANLGFPLEQLRELTPLDVSPGLSEATFHRLLRPLIDGVSERVESHGIFRRADGSTYPVSVAVQISTYGDRPVFVAIVADESEREAAKAEMSNLESQLRQAQKMETIGTLAGGIAHDFNNILSPILGYADLALSSVEGNDTAHRQIENIIEAAARAKKLVRQILTFSRRSDSEFQPIPMKRVVADAVSLIRASIPSSIRVNQDLGDDEGAIIADRTQIHQILLNLCTNALQAMPERGGRIDVTLEKLDLDSRFVTGRPALRPGPHFRLAVRDNGHGMSPETMDRIFEPFFTTKDASEGTGLGLSVVHGLVRSHGGSISVSSEIGKGTAFEIYLPYVTGEGVEELVPESPESRGTEHVLFVDDAPGITGLVDEMLQHLGYRATIETEPERALALFAANPDDFDILVTDHTMPDMTGIELAVRAHELRPDLPVVLVSGITETLPHADLEAAGIHASVMKPLTISDLGSSIREALDESH